MSDRTIFITITLNIDESVDLENLLDDLDQAIEKNYSIDGSHSWFIDAYKRIDKIRHQV
jgi:hypothetical protein